ncbi:hypothetical protein MIMGU_mgv1a019267mg [Erythranthe guttata]|uniref:GH18 domain-containing protein n=1 Tax=Erythranthe guttata TaxID=4155 RepID=A0A022R6X3_ERYGU|nr:hypothetical protein MIMGU_mgv1a019267mg [Erythranthe guttata]
MEYSSKLIFIFQLTLFIFSTSSSTAAANSNLFREYIGAEFNGVKFSDLPINQNVDFHFILSFAIDYTTTSTPTNGNFNVFWDTDNLTPPQVSAIKSRNPNVKVALSLGGDTAPDGHPAYFNPTSVESWLTNAVASLTKIIQSYNLDGIDIDYEHFKSTPEVFAECIGRLVSTLKNNGVISFASIAPFHDEQVQSHYAALWRSYGRVIDYVNFQFYAYDEGIKQSLKYVGRKVLVSFISDGIGVLGPRDGFFTACSRLKSEGNLHGIFVWSADDSLGLGFKYEKMSQSLLAISH